MPSCAIRCSSDLSQPTVILIVGKNENNVCDARRMSKKYGMIKDFILLYFCAFRGPDKHLPFQLRIIKYSIFRHAHSVCV